VVRYRPRLPRDHEAGRVAIFFEITIGTARHHGGLKRGKFLDNLVLISTLLVISIPVFVIGTVLQYFLGLLGIFPPTVPPGAPIGSSSFRLRAGEPLVGLRRSTRAHQSRREREVRLRAHGYGEGSAASPHHRLHVMRNSLIPVITFIGADFERCSAAPSSPRASSTSRRRWTHLPRDPTPDAAMVTGVVTVLVLVFLFVNLLVDLLYGVLDPRIRHE
jgi:oligopeptide transport system permease protein